MSRQFEIEESILVDAAPEAVYRLVADLRAMGRWSPECRRVWLSGPTARPGTRFVGFNRRGLFVWFTTGRVAVAAPGAEFTFDVGVLGLPIASWRYRFEPEGAGTRVTESWQDLRTGRGARAAELLGLVFAGTGPARRIEVNRAGIRTTLARLAAAAPGAPAA
ncbi:SRPBCC family protein [Kitasatospora sp. NPDC050543]|uniref:SRPBCC family protein n=1 Tax=Kitasatospora sp. NPDC050543 TaxID=3364054 RepID=UPI00379D36CA